MNGSFPCSKAVLLATALAASWVAAGQHSDSGADGADTPRWTSKQEGSDLQPGLEQDVDSCDGEAAACELSLRQLRGELRQHAPQHLSPVEGSLQHRLLGEGGSTESHLYRGSDEDYRPDAEAFLRARAGKTTCQLPRASLAEAESVGARLLDAHAQAHGFAPKRSLDHWPKDVRVRFAEEVFAKKPGLLEGVSTSWPATQLWSNSSALSGRLGSRHMMLKKFFFEPEAPIPSNELPAEMHPPPPETMSEYLARNESGRNYIIFLSEPLEESGINRAIIDALKPDIEPLPRFASPAHERQAIIAMDGVGSSAGWHRHAAVWQTQVTGRKAWWLMPPQVEQLYSHGPPRVNGRVYDHRNACELLMRQPPPPGALSCVLEPGETLVLPDKWWHATCGLDDITASAGGWMER